VVFEFNMRCDGFSIRPAAAADAKAVRMLLPELRDVAAVFVAVDGKQKMVIGAAAAARAVRRQPRVGPGVALHVIKPCRGHGVGATLVANLAEVARNAGAQALYAAKRVELGGEDMSGWQRLGFQPCETVEEHVLPITQLESRLGPLVDRMRAQGKIPASARVVHLYQADAAAVLQFHLDHMGGDRGELHRKLRSRGPGTFLPRQSRVLLIEGQVKGCLLAHREGKETIAIDANIVEPSLRGGWANAWLKLEAFRGNPPGVTQFRFTSFDHYADTRSFTRRLGGTTVRTTVLMMRSLNDKI
jgi:N-acetylglutamate synthase-like GNAT family acetyltransferase